MRPPTYYGEGPFDPPSSEDEDEDESLLLKETTRSLGMVERAGYAEPDTKVRPHPSPCYDQVLNYLPGRAQKRPSSLRYLLISLGTLVAISVVIGIVSAFTYSGTATFHGKLKMTLDHIANGTFYPQVQDLLWVPEGA